MVRLPDDNTRYQEREYWEERYRDTAVEESFDWFKSYADIRETLRELIPDQKSRILILGCGNSTLSEDMYVDGYRNILNVDYSESVIAKMRERCKAMPEMTWMVMDVRDLRTIPDGSIDVVIDKGTMDALMCEKGDVWEPTQELIENVAAEVNEVIRVLRPRGKFIYVTFGQPHFRRRHLERPDSWSFSYQTIGDAFHYFVYHMVKHE